MNRVERMRLRRRKKWMATAALFAALILSLLVWYYIRIQSPMWQAHGNAAQKALAETAMQEVTRVDRFTADDSYLVVTGSDEEGRQMYVSVGQEDLQTFFASDGVSREQIANTVLERNPDAEIVRVIPGIWEEQWVWEVFYKQREERGVRHFYDYYRLADGEWLETYRLALER